MATLTSEQAKALSDSIKREEILEAEYKRLGFSSEKYFDLEIEVGETFLEGNFSAAELRAIADAMDRIAACLVSVGM